MFALEVAGDLRLELLDRPHAAELFALVEQNRAHLSRWLPWVDKTRTIDDSLAFIDMTKRRWAEDNGFECAIRAGSELAGVVGFHEFNRSDNSASVGYWLGEAYQGHGHITRSLAKLMALGFEQYGLERIILRCATGNARSRAVAERLGMRYEGVLAQNEKIRGEYRDQYCFVTTKSSFHVENREAVIS